MSCFIYAETYDIPIDFWKHYIPKTNNNILCTFNDIEYRLHTHKCGNGFYVNISNEIYIITCFHVINYNYVKIISYYFNTDGKLCSHILKPYIIIEEFDIVILKIEGTYDIKTLHVYDEKECTRISDIDVNKSFDICTYLYDRTFLFQNGQTVTRTEFNNIEQVAFITKYITGLCIPFINVIPYEENIQYNGMSGSIVFNNSLLTGIVMIKDIASRCIQILPISICLYIVQSFLKTPQKNLSMIIMHTILVADENTDKSINYYGHYVTDSFDIVYMTPNRKKKHMFCKGDIIISFDGHQITKNGTIFCERFGSNIQIKTYFMFQIMQNDFVQIDYVRENNKCSCIINGVDPKMYLGYNLCKQYAFLYYDGFIFTELSEELLEYFATNNILSLLTENKQLNIVANKINKKYVALVSIEDHYSKTKQRTTKIKGIDISMKDQISILKKVGNDEVQVYVI